MYIGDTNELVFSINPELFEYKDIIVECTFLEEDDLGIFIIITNVIIIIIIVTIAQADKTKHCHWLRLREIIKSHPSNNFILYHFSTRYHHHYYHHYYHHHRRLYYFTFIIIIIVINLTGIQRMKFKSSSQNHRTTSQMYTYGSTANPFTFNIIDDTITTIFLNCKNFFREFWSMITLRCR